MLVDHAALVRGHVEPGETCEIPGVGPIPAATARALASDAILKVLVTDGVDVKAVAHAGRTIPAHVRSALEARDRECCVPGCHARGGLEIDHLHPYALGGPTTLDNLARLCHWHHRQKTLHGWQLTGSPGRWRWRPPFEPEARARGEPEPRSKSEPEPEPELVLEPELEPEQAHH